MIQVNTTELQTKMKGLHKLLWLDSDNANFQVTEIPKWEETGHS